MFSRIGGREPWARAKSIYIRYRQLSSGRRVGEGEERAWRDVSQPRERLELWRADYEGKTQSWGHSFNPSSGWRREPEGLRQYSGAEMGQNTTFWRRDFYTMFRRMAAGEPVLRYHFTAPNRIDVSEGGKDIGWWDVDRGGTLLRWGTTDNDGVGQLSYIYGPFKPYGPSHFPPAARPPTGYIASNISSSW